MDHMHYYKAINLRPTHVAAKSETLWSHMYEYIDRFGSDLFITKILLVSQYIFFYLFQTQRTLHCVNMQSKSISYEKFLR